MLQVEKTLTENYIEQAYNGIATKSEWNRRFSDIRNKESDVMPEHCCHIRTFNKQVVSEDIANSLSHTTAH